MASRMRARVTSDFLIEVAAVIVLNLFENRMSRIARHVKVYLNAFISKLGLSISSLPIHVLCPVRRASSRRKKRGATTTYFFLRFSLEFLIDTRSRLGPSDLPHPELSTVANNALLEISLKARKVSYWDAL